MEGSGTVKQTHPACHALKVRKYQAITLHCPTGKEFSAQALLLKCLSAYNLASLVDFRMGIDHTTRHMEHSCNPSAEEQMEKDCWGVGATKQGHLRKEK